MGAAAGARAGAAASRDIKGGGFARADGSVRGRRAGAREGGDLKTKSTCFGSSASEASSRESARTHEGAVHLAPLAAASSPMAAACLRFSSI